jgi:chemotaxis protein methyltransferase CheR
MNDTDCVGFLQEILPRLHLRWPGFRRVRRQVCRRLQQRLQELHLPDLAAYLAYLDQQPQELGRLDACCRITISRFCRDRGLFQLLERELLPQMLLQMRRDGRPVLRIWSAGCGSGEEPYTLAIVWEHAREPAFRQTRPEVLATDADPVMLQRARTACYPFSSLRDLPPDWRKAAFRQADGTFCLRQRYRQNVHLLRHDIRTSPPDGPFDLVLCRNLAFTYFDDALQRKTAGRIAAVLREDGRLVLGAHERLPTGVAEFVPWRSGVPVYRRKPAPPGDLYF